MRRTQTKAMSRQQEQRRAAAQAESVVRSFWVREPAGAGRYTVHSLLGKGQFGTVVRARSCACAGTGSPPRDVAIKRVDHVFANQGDAVRTIRELRFLREFCGHPNIVRLKDVLVPSQPTAFNTVYFVTSLMTKDLRQMISSKTTLEDQQLRWLMYQLLRGLSHIHGANVVHRDIKPANIVVDKHCNLKLCDFGLARAIFAADKQASDDPWTDYVATRWYRAPELLCAKPQGESDAGDSRSYTTQIDLWAAGAVLGEMLLRSRLFDVVSHHLKTGGRFPGFDMRWQRDPKHARDMEIAHLRKIFSIMGTPKKEDWPHQHLLRKHVSFQQQSPCPLNSIFPGE